MTTGDVLLPSSPCFYSPCPLLGHFPMKMTKILIFNEEIVRKMTILLMVPLTTPQKAPLLGAVAPHLLPPSIGAVPVRLRRCLWEGEIVVSDIIHMNLPSHHTASARSGGCGLCQARHRHKHGGTIAWPCSTEHS